MNDHLASAELSDARRIDLTQRTEDGEAVLALELLQNGTLLDNWILPYPCDGLGGAQIIMSPSERFAVVATYTGQSEEGYELFAVNQSLIRVGALLSQPGEAASYCFTPDERALVMAMPFTCVEWWTPWDEGEAEPDGTGRLSFAFGELRIHTIHNREISVHQIRVSVPASWQPARDDYDPYLRPEFVGRQRLGLSMPWGRVEVSLPLPSVVTLLPSA